MKPRYHTVAEEADRLHISARHLWNLIHAETGAIPHYRVGRRVLLVPEEVDAAVARHFGQNPMREKLPATRLRKEAA